MQKFRFEINPHMALITWYVKHMLGLNKIKWCRSLKQLGLKAE